MLRELAQVLAEELGIEYKLKLGPSVGGLSWSGGTSFVVKGDSHVGVTKE